MIDKEGLFMFRKRRAPSMEELQALEEMDQMLAAKGELEELIDLSEMEVVD